MIENTHIYRLKFQSGTLIRVVDTGKVAACPCYGTARSGGQKGLKVDGAKEVGGAEDLKMEKGLRT